MTLISGPRAHSQNWSRGFYDGYPGIEGVLYPSSLTNQTVYAFYERVLEVASPFPRLPMSMCAGRSNATYCAEKCLPEYRLCDRAQRLDFSIKFP